MAAEGVTSESIDLPANLEQTIVDNFDRLVDEGEILWGPYTSETVQQDGVNLVFQLSPYVGKKPIQERDDETRKTGQGRNPFLHPDPNFVITEVGNNHTLIFNKFPVYRPSLLLHTKEFVAQEEPLDESDIEAAWSVLRHLNQRTPQNGQQQQQQQQQRCQHLLIYNCGFDSGSSQGHKHMQIWPYPSSHEIGFELFPSNATSETEVATDLPGTPIRHYVLRLPDNATWNHVHNMYRRLLDDVRRSCHDVYGSTSHNVALTTEWICLIPRRSNGLDRGAGANAAGALGTVWLSEHKERDIWTKPTIASHLTYIGVPLDKYA